MHTSVFNIFSVLQILLMFDASFNRHKRQFKLITNCFVLFTVCNVDFNLNVLFLHLYVKPLNAPKILLYFIEYIGDVQMIYRLLFEIVWFTCKHVPPNCMQHHQTPGQTVLTSKRFFLHLV